MPQGSCLGPLLFTINSSKFISSRHVSACFPFFSHPQQRVVPTFPVFIPHQLPFHYACPCNYSSLIPQFTITTFTTQYSPFLFTIHTHHRTPSRFPTSPPHTHTNTHTHTHAHAHAHAHTHTHKHTQTHTNTYTHTVIVNKLHRGRYVVGG